MFPTTQKIKVIKQISYVDTDADTGIDRYPKGIKRDYGSHLT